MSKFQNKRSEIVKETFKVASFKKQTISMTSETVKFNYKHTVNEDKLNK